MPLESFPRHYAALRAGERPAPEEADAFDGHVLASALAMALAEVDDGGASLVDGLGLAPAEIGRLVDRHFPILGRGALDLEAMAESARESEEDLLRDLLLDNRSGSGPVAGWLAAIIARRSMRPDHLWQDLGLRDRGELGRLLERHFAPLHAGNVANMRWKKYFYRRLCEAEGFVLCAAPSCAVCGDFGDCFGDEDGLSRLAQLRLDLTRAA